MRKSILESRSGATSVLVVTEVYCDVCLNSSGTHPGPIPPPIGASVSIKKAGTVATAVFEDVCSKCIRHFESVIEAGRTPF